MSDKDGGFETWGIVEVMGHKQFAGRVCEVEIAGSGMVRVDVPEIGERPAFTKLFAPGALYAITPTDEATARTMAASLREQPVETWHLRLPAPVAIDTFDDDRDEQ